MVKSETLAMPLYSGMVKPVYFVRHKKNSRFVDNLIGVF